MNFLFLDMGFINLMISLMKSIIATLEGVILMKVRKFLTLRGFLNISGVLAIILWILTIYTHPITANSERGIFFDQSLMMSDQKIKEFLSFLLVVGLVYFPIVNIYCNKMNKEDRA